MACLSPGFPENSNWFLSVHCVILCIFMTSNWLCSSDDDGEVIVFFPMHFIWKLLKCLLVISWKLLSVLITSWEQISCLSWKFYDAFWRDHGLKSGVVCGTCSERSSRPYCWYWYIGAPRTQLAAIDTSHTTMESNRLLLLPKWLPVADFEKSAGRFLVFLSLSHICTRELK